ncbi:hypothetical protein LH612_34500, partial [Klebsiella pneumoniae]|nr:hypothetical protein [Klebsiella pneumoniae]
LIELSRVADRCPVAAGLAEDRESFHRKVVERRLEVHDRVGEVPFRFFLEPVRALLLSTGSCFWEVVSSDSCSSARWYKPSRAVRPGIFQNLFPSCGAGRSALATDRFVTPATPGLG